MKKGIIKDLLAGDKGEIIRYIIAGGLTTLVSLLSYFILTRTFFDPGNPVLLECAVVLSWIISVTFAYFANKYFVFLKKDTKIFPEIIGFFAARIVTLLVEMALMYIFVSLIGIDDRVMKIVCQIVILIGNYLFSKFLVFRKK